jgi:hypothetical protein
MSNSGMMFAEYCTARRHRVQATTDRGSQYPKTFWCYGINGICGTVPLRPTIASVAYCQRWRTSKMWGQLAGSDVTNHGVAVVVFFPRREWPCSEIPAKNLPRIEQLFNTLGEIVVATIKTATILYFHGVWCICHQVQGSKLQRCLLDLPLAG